MLSLLYTCWLKSSISNLSCKKSLVGTRYASGAVLHKTLQQSPFWSRPLNQLLGSKSPQESIVPGEKTVKDAIEHMEKMDMSVVAVSSAGGEWLGILSERDVIRLLAKGGNIQQTYVKDALSKKQGIATCSLDQKVSDLGKIFATQNVQNIVVLKGTKKGNIHDLAGLITSREVAQYFHSLETNVVEEFENILVKDMLDHNKDKVRERLHDQSILALQVSSRVKDAVELMAQYGVGCILVTSDHSKGALHPYPDVVGMFTEREFIRDGLLKGKDPNSCKVGDIMFSRMPLVTPEFSAAQFIRLFADSHVRYLPVFSTSPEDAQDSTSTCLGLFSIKDVFSFCFQLAESRS